MIIKTQDELKEAVGFPSLTGSITSIKPDLLLAEEKLKNFVSAAQFDLLQSQLDNAAIVPGSDQDVLLSKCRAVVGFLALHNFASKNNVSYEKSGIHSSKTGNTVPVREWMLNDMKGQVLEDAYTCIDYLLAFLESKKDIFTVWAASSSFTINKSFIVNSLDKFQEHYSLTDSRYTFMLLRPAMRFVEDIHISEAIGMDYFHELKTKIKDGDVTSDDQLIIDSYLTPAVVYHTVARACDTMNLKLSGNGIKNMEYMSTGEQSKSEKAGSAQQIFNLKQTMRDNASLLLSKAVEYLNSKASDILYTTYFNSSAYTSSTAEESGIVNTSDSGFFAAL